MNISGDCSDGELPDQVPPIGLRRRPSLLPAFDPCSSSSGLTRITKRKHDGGEHGRSVNLKRDLTPEPSSATVMPLSSPPLQMLPRPSIHRTASTISERAPLSAVPSLLLARDGTPTLMGRSSNSSHYQLSANRLVSRIHVKAIYSNASEAHKHGEVVVECLGWNGAKIHCQSQVFELGKGDSFASDKPLAAIMVDVQDARVILRWPDLHRGRSGSVSSDATWADEVPQCVDASSPPSLDALASSPPLMPVHLRSPVSPSIRLLPDLTAASTFLGAPAIPKVQNGKVEVYEDDTSGDERFVSRDVSSGHAQLPAIPVERTASLDLPLLDYGHFSDHDAENEAVMPSAPQPAVSREEASLKPNVNDADPPSPAAVLLGLALPKSISVASCASAGTFELSPIQNHVINQLAYSRLHSLPLSTILNNLPMAMRQARETAKSSFEFSDAHLKHLLDKVSCIGEIAREGKDAAGKALEDEFYYIPEKDSDESRRNAVGSGLGKTSLRAVRKQHKVCIYIQGHLMKSLMDSAILLEAATKLNEDGKMTCRKLLNAGGSLQYLTQGVRTNDCKRDEMSSVHQMKM